MYFLRVEPPLSGWEEGTHSDGQHGWRLKHFLTVTSVQWMKRVAVPMMSSRRWRHTQILVYRNNHYRRRGKANGSRSRTKQRPEVE